MEMQPSSNSPKSETLNLSMSDREIGVKLVELIEQNDEAEVKSFLQESTNEDIDWDYIFNRNYYGENDTTPLIIIGAMSNNIHIMIDILSVSCVYVNNTSKLSNMSALHIACKNDNKEMVKLLMRHNGNPNIKTINNETTIYFAAKNGNKDIIKILLNLSNEYEYTFNWV